jgi:Dolichyl-phosphate-mannose-protein mannosyltransferase
MGPMSEAIKMTDHDPAARSSLRVYLALALVLLAICGVGYPLGFDTPLVRYSYVRRLIQTGIVTAASFGFLVFLWRRNDPAAVISLWLRAAPGKRAAVVGVLAFAATLLVALAALRSVSLSADEAAYVFQADMFAHGKVWVDALPIQPYIWQNYIFVLGGKVISQYPPGWPAVLAVAQVAGMPLVLVNPILGALTLLALWRFAMRQHGREVALIAVALMATSLFFLFNSASFYNGPITALLGVLFVGAVCSFLDRPSVLRAIGLGVWFSAIAATRHLDAILFAVPAAAVMIRRCNARHWSLLPVAALSAAPPLAVMLYYYFVVTGRLFTTPQTLNNPDDRLLGIYWHAGYATKLVALRIFELMEWTSPTAVAAFCWALAQKIRWNRFRFFDFYPVVFLAGYWLYFSDGGLRWGPRYIYPALPFMMLTIADYAWSALRERSQVRFMHLVAVSVVVSALQVPFVAARVREMIDQTEDIAGQVSAAELHHAVVVAISGPGDFWTPAFLDIPSNGPATNGDVIYAHGPRGDVVLPTPAEIDETVQALRAYFPTREIWLYVRDDNVVHGRLVKA